MTLTLDPWAAAVAIAAVTAAVAIAGIVAHRPPRCEIHVNTRTVESVDADAVQQAVANALRAAGRPPRSIPRPLPRAPRTPGGVSSPAHTVPGVPPPIPAPTWHAGDPPSDVED